MGLWGWEEGMRFEEWEGVGVSVRGGRFAPLMRNVLISTLASIRTGKCQSLPNVSRAYKR